VLSEDTPVLVEAHMLSQPRSEVSLPSVTPDSHDALTIMAFLAKFKHEIDAVFRNLMVQLEERVPGQIIEHLMKP
jgi:hypothetical protein